MAILSAAMATLALPGFGAQPARCDEAKDARSQSAPAIATIERGLTFLEKDAVKWKEERTCATCHHGTMTVWALNEAKSQGYAVDSRFLAEMVEWTRGRFLPNFKKPRDPRPGWNLVSVPAIYLGVMSQNLPVLSRAEVHVIAGHLARHQEADGAWLLPPPANGAPPIWESRETLALWAYLAWEPYVPADPAEAAQARASREKAAAWLAATPPTETVQATALRLLVDVRTGKPEEQVRRGVDRLLGRQNSDGGWSQVKEMPSDAFATGQILWVLSFAGVKGDRPEVGRAVAFLVANQREDGSWPMTSRDHPGVKSTRNPIRNPVPITYFGAAWATLGLVRMVPPAVDQAAIREKAIGAIREYHGKYDLDEADPDRPLVRVDLRDYALDDQEVARFASLLKPFPRLAEIRFKSAKITDAGLAPLKDLTQLRTVGLEDTKVTDGGVRELQKALPNLKVER